MQVRENIRNKSETFVIQPLGTCTISLTSETKKKAFILPFYFFARKFLEEKTRSEDRGLAHERGYHPCALWKEAETADGRYGREMINVCQLSSSKGVNHTGFSHFFFHLALPSD